MYILNLLYLLLIWLQVAPTLTALASIIAQSEGSAGGTLFAVTQTAGDDDEDDDEGTIDCLTWNIYIYIKFHIYNNILIFYIYISLDEEDMQKMAHVIIDVMAVSIPSKHFMEPAMSISAQGMCNDWQTLFDVYHRPTF